MISKKNIYFDTKITKPKKFFILKFIFINSIDTLLYF